MCTVAELVTDFLLSSLENFHIINSQSNLRSSKSKRLFSLKFDMNGSYADPPTLLLLASPQPLSQFPLSSLILLPVSLPDLPRLLHLFVHFVDPFFVFFLLRLHVDFELDSVLFATFLFFLNSFCISLQLTKCRPLPCTLLPPANDVWSKVMLLHLCVSHSFHRGEGCVTMSLPVMNNTPVAAPPARQHPSLREYPFPPGQHPHQHLVISCQLYNPVLSVTYIHCQLQNY